MTTNHTTAPTINRSTRGLRFLAGLAIAAGSVAGAFAADAGATEAASAPSSAAATVAAPTTPAGGGSLEGSGAATERVNPKALYWRQIWARTVYDPYGSYRNYYATYCRNNTYPYSWKLTWNAGAVKTYRCSVLTRY